MLNGEWVRLQGKNEDKQNWDQYRKQNFWAEVWSMELTGNK